MAVHDLIQSACAVIAILLGLYGLAPDRRAQLREFIRAISSTVMAIVFYIVLIALIYISAKEIVQFAHNQAPMTRYEVIDLIINVMGVCGFVWAGFFLYANLGRGTESE